jgi:hypothetical protein
MSGSSKVERWAFLRLGDPTEDAQITLSQRERQRSKVLHEVEEGHLKQVEAARRLRLTVR